jgi:hypothetical protein
MRIRWKLFVSVFQIPEVKNLLYKAAREDFYNYSSIICNQYVSGERKLCFTVSLKSQAKIESSRFRKIFERWIRIHI